MASQGTQASLRDLLAALATAEEKVEAGELAAEAATNAVTSLQQLVRILGRPAVLARLEESRRRLARWLGEWSHAAFESARAEIEQRLGGGDVSGAVQAAERLEERAKAGTYPDAAAYDQGPARRQARSRQSLRRLPHEPDQGRRLLVRSAAPLFPAFEGSWIHSQL